MMPAMSHSENLRKGFSGARLLSKYLALSLFLPSALLVSNLANAARSAPVAVPQKPDFTYYRETSLRNLISTNQGLLLVSTGLSESSLANLRSVANGEKQKRGLGHAFFTILNYYKQGGQPGKAKLIFLSTNAIRHWDKTNRRYVNNRALHSNLLHLYQTFTGDYDEAAFERFFDENIFIYEFNPRMKEGQLDDKLEMDLNVLKNDGTLGLAVSGKNTDVFRYIRSRISFFKAQGFHTPGLAAHLTGTNMSRWAAYFGIPAIGLRNTELSEWGSKTGSKNIFNEADLEQPRGTYNTDGTMARIRSVEDMAANAMVLFEAGAKKLILKLDKSAAGKGNHPLDLSEFTDKKGKNPITREKIEEKIRALKDSEDEIQLYCAELPPVERETIFIRRMKSEGAMLEEMIIGEDCISPASLAMIDNHESYQDSRRFVTVYDVYNQVLDGAMGQHFGGALSGPGVLDPELQSFLRQKTEDVGHALARKGARGYYGVDFMVCKMKDAYGQSERKVFGIEINLRQTGTLYPRRMVNSLVGEAAARTKFMFSIDDIDLPATKHHFGSETAFTDYINHVYRSFSFGKQRDLVFSKTGVRNRFGFEILAQNEGIFISLDFHGLGKIGIVSVANSEQKAKQLKTQFEERLKEITEVYKRSTGIRVAEATYEAIQEASLPVIPELAQGAPTGTFSSRQGFPGYSSGYPGYPGYAGPAFGEDPTQFTGAVAVFAPVAPEPTRTQAAVSTLRDFRPIRRAIQFVDAVRSVQHGPRGVPVDPIVTRDAKHGFAERSGAAKTSVRMQRLHYHAPQSSTPIDSDW